MTVLGNDSSANPFHAEKWAVWGLALAAVFAGGIGYCLFQMPFTVWDAVDQLVDALLRKSTWAAMWETPAGYWRPLRVLQIDLLFVLTGGQSLVAYKIFHILLTLALFLLFARLLPVRSGRDLAAFAVAATVLVGIHTSAVLFLEAYPVNHFLEIAVLCLLVVFCAQRQRHFFNDVVTIGALGVGLGTLDSGVLIWVCMIVAYVVGARGISRGPLVVGTLLLGAYLVVRLGYSGAPSLSERSSGFGFRVLDPGELIERFGENPMPFYLYNVLTSWLSVLVSEPRAGRWAFLAVWLSGSAPVWMYVNLVTSALLSTIITGATVARVRDWTRRQVAEGDLFLVLFWVVLAANGVISYAYTKDVIMSPAGVFYAAAGYVALKRFLMVARARVVDWNLRAALIAGLLILSLGWSSRAAGLFFKLRYQAYRHSNDWAMVDRATQDWPREVRSNPSVRTLLERFRAEALARPVPHPRFRNVRALERYFGDSE